MAPQHTKYYDLLSVNPTATPAKIRKAYRLKALQHHPDRAGNTKEATEAFQNLKAVYEVLSDPERRALYDEQGEVGNLHGDDEAFDADNVAAFFSRAKNPVSAEDILAYERTYRNGEDEREDLMDFFKRFDGAVKRAVDYIPYSDESDLIRFVTFWDEQITDGDLNDSEEWRKARKALAKAGKGKERDLNAPVLEGPCGNAKDVAEGNTDGKASERKKTKKSKEVNGMGDLMAQIAARQNRGKESFDAWAERIEAQSKKEGGGSERHGGRRKSQGEASALKAEGGVKKKRKAR